MATVLHRTTKVLQISVSPNGLSEPRSSYIFFPDLSAVAGQPIKYWVITGNAVSLMDAAAIAVVDAAELQANKDAAEAESQRGILKAVVAALVKTINIRLPAGQKITPDEIRTAIKGEL